jgi:hypothetical protein
MNEVDMERLGRYVAGADARRIKFIDDKRLRKEQQGALKDAERKEGEAQTKGKKTRSYVSDATAAQIENLSAWKRKVSLACYENSVLGLRML